MRRLVTVFGIGRVCHIAFWEPHFAEEFPDLDDWKAQTHRLGVALHPLTIEQNAITSFASRTTLVPGFANTIGPGLFLQSDYCIGGADGAFRPRLQWQGMSIGMTLQYGPDPWLPSTFMPTLPGQAVRREGALRAAGAGRTLKRGRPDARILQEIPVDGRCAICDADDIQGRNLRYARQTRRRGILPRVRAAAEPPVDGRDLDLQRGSRSCC